MKNLEVNILSTTKNFLSHLLASNLRSTTWFSTQSTAQNPLTATAVQNKYNKEDEYCGWNMLNKDYLRQLREVQTAEAEVDEDLRSQVDAANAVLDVTVEAACAGCS
jgi:hypothetical protein